MGKYSGLGSILARMERVTSSCGYIVLSGNRRGGGRKRKSRYPARKYPRSSEWWRTWAEV